jgi:prophage antirepressor-like protein
MARAERKGDSLKDETPGAATPRASNSNSKAEEPDMSNANARTYPQQDTAQVIPFDFRSAEVRAVVAEDGEPWFVLDDVAPALGYTRSRNAARILDDDEKGAHNVSTPGGAQKMTTLNESGIYHLCFKSRRPEAQAFRKWVTAEVLPAIRKTGRYEMPAEMLTAGQKGHIVRSVKDVVAKTGKHFQTVYHGINEAFGVATYKDIPAARYPELCRHLGVAPLEGEWLPAPGQEGLADGVSLNDMLGVVAHMEWIDKAWDELGPALRGLGSPWAGRMHDHVRDGALFAGSLRRRHGDEMQRERQRIAEIGRGMRDIA